MSRVYMNLANGIHAMSQTTTPPNAPEVDVLAPTPMVENRLGIGMDCAYRMDAYYYGFSPTGLDVIDRILSAVACAGKGYHHTEDWNQECSIRHDYQRGTSPAEIIHNAAIDSANLIRAAVAALLAREAALVAERDALAAEVGALRGLLSDTAANLDRMAGDEFSDCDLVRLNYVVTRINDNLARTSAARAEAGHG